MFVDVGGYQLHGCLGDHRWENKLCWFRPPPKNQVRFIHYYLVVSTHLKNIYSKWESSPKFGVKIKKCLKLPPRSYLPGGPLCRSVVETQILGILPLGPNRRFRVQEEFRTLLFAIWMFPKMGVPKMDGL